MERGIFVRHGESEYSARELVNGDPSVVVGLTEEGREQARLLYDRLESEPVDLWVVTEFGRTRETADLTLGDRHELHFGRDGIARLHRSQDPDELAARPL